MKSLGMGRRTRECNPSGRERRLLRSWLATLISMKDESDQMLVDAVVEMIHARPLEDRSHFAREIWRLRRERGRLGETVVNMMNSPC